MRLPIHVIEEPPSVLGLSTTTTQYAYISFFFAYKKHSDKGSMKTLFCVLCRSIPI